MDAQPNIDRFKQFLNLRCCGGKLLGDFFLEPEFKGNSWWRFRCHSDYLPKFDSAPDADWNKAWHGTKMENLYAIIAAKTLIPGPTQLEHVANAVYVCGDHIRSHANFYMRYVPLCQDGVFWAVKWEVSVDRNRKFPSSKTNQWLQRPGSVVLEALWVSGKTSRSLLNDEVVQLAWYPHLEVRPPLPMPKFTQGLPAASTLPLPLPEAASASKSSASPAIPPPPPPPPPSPAFLLGAATAAVSKTGQPKQSGMAKPAKPGRAILAKPAMARPAKPAMGRPATPCVTSKSGKQLLVRKAAASKPPVAASEVKAAASKPPTAASNAKGAAAVCGDPQHEVHVLVAADRSARRQLQAAAKKRVKPQVSSFARRSLSVEARKRKHVAVENRSKERPVLKRSNAQVDLTADDSNAPVAPGMARPADPGMVAESDMPTEPSTAFVDPGMARPADPGMARLALTDMPTEPGMARPANPVVQMAEQNRTVESGSSVPVARLGSRMLGSRDLALLRARAEGRSDP